MRPISVSFPSGKVKMTLWRGTEDEEAFEVRATKTRPYVLAYGKKYFLTDEEIRFMQAFI